MQIAKVLFSKCPRRGSVVITRQTMAEAAGYHAAPADPAATVVAAIRNDYQGRKAARLKTQLWRVLLFFSLLSVITDHLAVATGTASLLCRVYHWAADVAVSPTTEDLLYFVQNHDRDHVPTSRMLEYAGVATFLYNNRGAFTVDLAKGTVRWKEGEAEHEQMPWYVAYVDSLGADPSGEGDLRDAATFFEI